MKQRYFILLASLLFVACKKDADTTASTGNFIITGVRDVDLTVTSNGSYSFPITVAPSGSAKDTVTLSGEQLPGGVYANFEPATGVTPFASRVTISTDYSGSGGTYPFKIVGNGHSGSKSYDIRVMLDYFRGWQLGSIVYEKTGLSKDAGSGTAYPTIKVNGPMGQQLILSFSSKAGLPTKTSAYRIASDSSTAADNVEIAMYDGAHIYRATGYNTDGSKPATGVFTFDTLRKFSFRCANVQMSDGLEKLPLNCAFGE